MLAHEVKLQAADRNRKIESFLRADRNWLQRDRPPESANQDVGPDAAANGGFRTGAAVAAGERARPAPGRRIDHPSNFAAGGIADVEPDAGDAAPIGLTPAAHGFVLAGEPSLWAGTAA